MSWHIWQWLIAFDQMVNAALGGWSDETFSARCYRLRNKTNNWRIAYRTVNAIFSWQVDHCQQAYGSEMARMQVPEEYRK